jgi:hypothetical protein
MLQNNPYLYTGGAVKLDSTPYTNFQSQLLAKKAARDEALDDYYRNLTKGINPAGLRTQDVNGFMQRTNELQNFYQQNRDRIKNPRLDNGAAQTRYGQMFQDALMYVNSSKNEEEKKKPLVSIMSDPDKRDRIPDGVFEQLHSHDLPLDDPKRQSFDISHLEYDPKPFDLPKYLKGFEHIARHDDITVGQTDPKTLMRNITTKSTYDEPAKQQIYGIAASDYMNDHSFKAAVDGAMKDKGTYDRLNDIFKSNYGHNIENEHDFAAAYTIEKLQPEIRKEAVKEDIYAREKQMAALNNAYHLGQIQFSHALSKADKQTQDLWIDDFVSDLPNKAIGDITYHSEGKTISGKTIPLTPVLESALKVNGTTADFLIATPDGNFRYGLYKRTTDANKNTTVDRDKSSGGYIVDQSSSRVLTPRDLKLAMGKQAGVKQMNSEMSKGVTQPKTYNVSGKTYSQEQIEKGAKHYGLTVDEYLKQLGIK